MNKKNIGILTHSVSRNYGANLQAVSTAFYLKNHGFNPIFINWITESSDIANHDQRIIHDLFLKRLGFELSQPCVNDEDFLKVIDDYCLKNIIVGSDCVLVVESKHLLPFRITRKGIRRNKKLSDHFITYQFPNAFWLPFLQNRKDVKRFLMSGSCGTSDYKNISRNDLIKMNQLLSEFDYISARDTRTMKMVKKILGKEYNVSVTPDPVFGFNYNVNCYNNEEQIRKKFSLPEKYFVFSYYNGCWPTQQWVDRFTSYAHEKGIKTVSVKMPQGGVSPNFDLNIELPLDPLDWYSIIRYSDGYVGNNMHPIIVSIHNSVPFISINHHTDRFIPGIWDLASKTKEVDLLQKGHLMRYHTTQTRYRYHSVKSLVDKLLSFDRKACSIFASQLQTDYITMMDTIISRFV